jgi:hypothetical protein
MLPSEPREGWLKIGIDRGGRKGESYSDRSCRILNLCTVAVVRGVGRIHQNSDDLAGYDLSKQLQPFRHQVGGQDADPGHVGLGAIEVHDKGGNARTDDRDRRGRLRRGSS